MKSPIILLVSSVVLLHIIFLHGSAAYVSVDDCEESGAHRYHSHAQRSASYTQTHPAPSGYRATSSSYMRSGSGGHSESYNQDGDLQTAQSVYSPVMTKSSGYQDAGSSGYGYRSRNEESSSYGSRAQGYGTGNTGYASSNSDSHVRQNFEKLKTEADAFVHGGARPPANGFASVPIGSQVRQAGSSSQYQASSSRYGSSGNVLGVSYGSTGTEDEENSQKLISVPATLPASGGLVGSHKESHDSAISYSTSGVLPPTDGVDLSVSHSSPLAPLAAAYTSSSQQHNFETLKEKADSFVHKGGPPPTPISSEQVATVDGFTNQATRVETLPVRHTDRNTMIVPVRVTVTREHTVLPGGTEQEYYDQTGGARSSQSSSYSSSRQSSTTNSGTTGPNYSSGNYGSSQPANTVVYSQPSLGSSSSYSYNAQAVNVPPKVYTVGPAGSISFPENNLVQESSTASYGSTYSKQTSSNVRQENVVVPGAVALVNEEEAQRRSSKLFDLVSGYGTFLPAREEEVKNTGVSSSSFTSSSAQTSHTAGGEGYRDGGVSDYQSGVTGVQTGVSSQGVSNGYQQVSTDYNTRVSGGGAGNVVRTSGVYPASTVRKTNTVYYQGNPTHLAPGVPIGDPLTPPEVSGSYFMNGGVGRQSYTSNDEIQSNYGTRGGYASGYNAQNSGYSNSQNRDYSRDSQSSGYSRDSQSSGYSRNSQNSGYGYTKDSSASGYGLAKDSSYGYGLHKDSSPVLCESAVCENANIIPGSTGNVNKYGISSSWSSKSQTVNGKTTESKQAIVTVNDNGKVDTYATHTR